MDCGCFSLAPVAPTQSALITGATFNESPATLVVVSPFGHCDNPCNRGRTDFSTAPKVHLCEYADCNDCSCPPTFPCADVGFVINLTLISGIYYLMARVVIGGVSAIVFYGTTPDLSLPIANECVCQPTLITWDNPLIECIFGTSLISGSASHDGYATIS